MASEISTAGAHQDLRRRVAELERELGESHRREAASAEVLEVISRSTFNLQAVLDGLIESAVRLTGAEMGLIYRQDGDFYRAAAIYGASPEFIEVVKRNPIPPGRASATGRAVLERRVIHIQDVVADAEYTWAGREGAEVRTILAVPMLRDGAVIGVIVTRRTRVQPFTDKQIDLLTTFANHAVIAIENTRLFEEVQTRTRELAEALEQQTATAEILGVISRSPTDAQPVFDIIGERAEKLCDAQVSVVTKVDGELIQLASLHGVAQEGVELVRRAFPMPRSAETVTARTVRTCVVVHVPDVLVDPKYEQKDTAKAGGYRGCLGVPMVREGQVIGAIFVARAQPGLFPTIKSNSLKPSPTRPSSPSRTRGCSKPSRQANASCRNPWNTRPQ